MRTYLGTFLGLPRFSVGAVLLGLLAFAPASRASVIASWDQSGLPTLAKGGSLVAHNANGGLDSSANLTHSDVRDSKANGYTITVNDQGFIDISITVYDDKNTQLTHWYDQNSVSQGYTGTTPTLVSSGTYAGDYVSTISFSSDSSLGWNDTFYFWNAANVKFYNIEIDGVVPEPVNYALAGFGLILVGGFAGHTLRRKLSAAKVA